MKTAVLTVSISFKLRTLILTVSVTLITYALSVTAIMSVHVSLSVFLEFESLNKLTDCDSISREVNKSLKISEDVLIDKGQLILNTLNID